MNTPTAALAVLLLVPVPSATAAPVPAYGTITIRDDGLGARVAWTYTEPPWDCGFETDGTQRMPYAIEVTCVPFERLEFACPLMVLTVRTLAAGRAGGGVRCTQGLELGIVTGNDMRSAAAALGAAPSIVCEAYGGGLPLVPPYEVTCSEPGLPGYSSRGSEE